MTITDEQVDLSDLDLLDDEDHHARCTFCQPVPLGTPFVALCGVRSIHWNPDQVGPPPNACAECVALWDEPCRRCGH